MSKCVRIVTVYSLLFAAAFLTACKTNADNSGSSGLSTIATTAVKLSQSAYTLHAQDYSSNISAFTTFQGYADTAGAKLVALTETWNDGDYDSGSNSVTTDTSSSNFWSGEY